MVHFFGILKPGFGPRIASPDAPLKADFFGGRADLGDDTAAPSRAELDAAYLTGKSPQPADEREDAVRFVRLCLPPYV